MVPIEVRVPAPTIAIVPTHVDLGVISRGELFTNRAALEVQNRGKGRADCQIEGNPPWLFLDPQRFVCPPGQTQVVEMVGRVDLLPTEQPDHRTILRVSVEGDRPHQVVVSVRMTDRETRRSRLGPAVAIGFATLILIGAITWFVATVLVPLLGL
jgi:hypothetical protein